MIAFLDAFGPALFRASWQAAILAVAVAVALRAIGDRIAPRWRYLLWGVVVARMLVVTTPASPWSAFNLVGSDRPPDEPRPARSEPGPPIALNTDTNDGGPSRIAAEPPRVDNSARSTAPPADAPPVPAGIPQESAERPARGPSWGRILSSIALAGSLACGVQLLGAALVLRRRLSICRPVTDPAVLALLESACLGLGLRRRPALLVTPESISPCIAGTWKPRIVVPESIVSDPSGPTLAHVLTHEVAHLVRGDLWTNWLLLAARVLHWFNPASWWAIRAMRAEREAACDERAVAALGESDRSAYAATIVDLAASLTPSGMAPAMIGLIASNRRLADRIERLQRRPPVRPLRAPAAAGLVLATALVGLTDARPAPATDAPAPVAEQKDGPEARTATLRGRCVDDVAGTSMPGVRVRLFKAEGRTAPIVEVAKVVTDAEGRFEFPHLVSPRVGDPADPLMYLVFAEADDRPIGPGGIWVPQFNRDGPMEIRIAREKTSLAGRVIDARGNPVAGAAVAQWAIDGRPVPGVLSATTGADGRFLITRLPRREGQPGRPADSRPMTFTVSHRDHPESRFEVPELPRNVTFALPAGCRVTGTVKDDATGRPAAGATVIAERLGEFSETAAATDADGRFTLALPEDRYTFRVVAADRVGVAIIDRECRAGEALELPPFILTAGGFIAGRVINAATGQPIATTEAGEPVAIGLIGPSHPLGQVLSPSRDAATDRDGRFTLRAAPGENFPYLVNLHGDRMGWDTTKQPAVRVKEGETTHYDLLVTPKLTPAEKLQRARKVVDALPAPPSERTARILLEFRKLQQTVDETELWCSLMLELVAIGREATPQLSAELDRTAENRALRRLAFAARAIGDPRAVPALIRAIPRTLLPGSSDYGLIVADAALARFMQTHDLRDGPTGGRYFSFGRPEREVIGALRKLTGQSFDDAEILGVSLSEDPRRQWYQRRIFTRHARAWQAWWDRHAREFTDDPAYLRVGLKDDEAPPPRATTSLGPNARLGDGVMGETLSPAIQEGAHAVHFYDLDTGVHPAWPAHLPRDEARLDPKQLAAWAADNGVDLMCVTHRAPDGKETFVLRSFGMKTWEISPRDTRNLGRLLAAGTLPKGHDTGDLLMHHDEASNRPVPDANAAFLYVTSEGCMGLIEITDRVTRTADLTGMPSGPPAGVGFHVGVRCNLKSIIP